jgi:hypothetical protein
MLPSFAAEYTGQQPLRPPNQACVVVQTTTIQTLLSQVPHLCHPNASPKSAPAELVLLLDTTGVVGWERAALQSKDPHDRV